MLLFPTGPRRLAPAFFPPMDAAAPAPIPSPRPPESSHRACEGRQQPCSRPIRPGIAIRSMPDHACREPPGRRLTQVVAEDSFWRCPGFDVGPDLTGRGKTPPNPVIRRPRFGGEGSALCGCKPMQILRRLLAPQNDIIRGLFPQPVEPEFTPRGRATRAIASTRAGLKPRSAPHGEVNSPLRQQAGAPE